MKKWWKKLLGKPEETEEEVYLRKMASQPADSTLNVIQAKHWDFNDRITAGSITSDKIVANQITASKINWKD